MSVTIVDNTKKSGKVSHVLDWPEGMCGWDHDGDPVVRVSQGIIMYSGASKPQVISEKSLLEDMSDSDPYCRFAQNPSGTRTITFN